jgi:DnaK suppressor protein
VAQAMFVSILQLMGFPLGKPVNSRAEEGLQRERPTAPVTAAKSRALNPAANAKPARQTLTSDVHSHGISARRQEVKSQPVKTKITSKATSVATKGKSALKLALQPKAKPKPKLKPAIAGKAVKAPGKKAAPVKKTPAKVPVKVIKTKPAKVLAPVAKVQSKDSVKKTFAKTNATEVIKPKHKASAPVAVVKIAVPAMPVKPMPEAAVANLANAVPVRAGRPSSRLAQLTVPSMAQSVASTAAKASFSQTKSEPLIVPPLASAVKKNPKLANNWKLKPLEQLTDADVIAMPEEEYMNDTQMRFFRLKLLTLKHDILNNAGETTEHLRADTVVVPDPADRATIEEEHALELRTRDRERKLLKKIEQSITRIDAGDYGYCDETGEAIGVGRLMARPTANLSLEAQQRRELKQKMFGD